MYRVSVLILIIMLCIYGGHSTFSGIYCDGLKKNKVVPINVAGIELEVELAITPEELALGLMHRKKLENNEGMLFAFPKERFLSFWMKNTSIPLSIAFIKGNGRIIQIESMKPYSLDTHISKEKVMYALEMNDGWFKMHNVKEGDIIKIPSILNGKGKD
jgi:uncharacterized protein